MTETIVSEAAGRKLVLVQAGERAGFVEKVAGGGINPWKAFSARKVGGRPVVGEYRGAFYGSKGKRNAIAEALR